MALGMPEPEVTWKPRVEEAKGEVFVIRVARRRQFPPESQ